MSGEIKDKVLLLNSSFTRSGKRKDYLETVEPQIRVGVASVASCLRENGAEVTIEDPEMEKLGLRETVERIIEKKPRFLGLPAYTEEIKHASAIAETVKKNRPDITIIVGGPHVSALPEETLREFKSFDIGVTGEGELTVTDIVRGVRLEQIPGIVYRTDGHVFRNPQRELIESLDRIPPPAYDLYQVHRYGLSLPIEPLRGCPYRCVFCFRALGRKVRYKSAERIVTEIEYNMKRFGISSFRFLAGTFPLDRQHAVAVCEKILKRDLKIDWTASTRVDAIDKELLQIMKRSGCSLLQIGVESGDSELLKLCGKEITIKRILEAFQDCKQVGIKAGANFIIGLPGETKESIHKTLSLALKIRENVFRSNFAILVPFPGTEVYEKAVRNEDGLKLKSSDWDNFGKQAGRALVHESFPGKRLVLYQTMLYLMYRLNSPSQLIGLLLHNSGRTLIQGIKRLFSNK